MESFIGLDDETRRVVGELAEQASELTELYNQWLRDMPNWVLRNLDKVVVATDKFRAGESDVDAEINRRCAPFFEWAGSGMGQLIGQPGLALGSVFFLHCVRI